MLKSIWFWLLLVVGIIVLYFAWDRIEARLPDSMLDQPTRTTNTKQLATTLTPARTPDWDPVNQTGSSSAKTVTPKFVPVTKTSGKAAVVADGQDCRCVRVRRRHIERISHVHYIKFIYQGIYNICYVEKGDLHG